MSIAADSIEKKLFALQDAGYQAFQRKLVPNLPPEKIIGVQMPALRALAKELSGTREAEAFLARLPHRYYEEDNLHGFLLERIRSYEEALAGVEAFLPYVDNWATCDTMSPPVFGKNRDRLLEPVERWIHSGRTYTVRYGLGMLMRYYLDDGFRPEYLALAGKVTGDDYYIRMMVAWYFATALAKQPQAAWPWVAEPRLSGWVRAKAIQKALESRRITPEQKEALRALRASL